MSYTYEYPRPSLTLDTAIFIFPKNQLKILLIQRKNGPFKNFWALPGGFLEMDETLETGAYRELLEETGVKNVYLEQLYTFSDVNRDPRGRVITVAYMALLRPSESPPLKADSDARQVKWFSVYKLPKLAFDHKKIIQYSLERLRNKLNYTTVGFQLLEEEFTLTELQQVYEVILKRKLDKRNFRKKMLSLKILNSRKEFRKSGANRPAQLYELNKKKFLMLHTKGFTPSL
ncbi:MAG: NUDIX domain-containing protein [Planctomycetota bacterium]